TTRGNQARAVMVEGDEEGPTQRQTVVLLAVVVEGGLIVLAWLLGWLLDVPPLRTFDWDFRAALWGAAAPLPLMVLFSLAFRWAVGPLGRIKEFSERVLCPMLAPCSVVDMLGIAVLAGLGEEMLFRGVLQGSFARWMPSLLALFLASALFGVVHA